jgi:hypothetical protein
MGTDFSVPAFKFIHAAWDIGRGRSGLSPFSTAT